MTDVEKEYILNNWKKFTTSQLALNLTSATRTVYPSEVHTFLTKRGIEPVTKRDLVTKQVIELYGNGMTTPSAIGSELKISAQLAKDIIEEYGLTIKGIKVGPRAKANSAKDASEIKQKLLNLENKKKRSAEIKASRASFTVYNQTGSPILDELRNIKTTEREKTLLSTGKK